MLLYRDRKRILILMTRNIHYYLSVNTTFELYFLKFSIRKFKNFPGWDLIFGGQDAQSTYIFIWTLKNIITF